MVVAVVAAAAVVVVVLVVVEPVPAAVPGPVENKFTVFRPNKWRKFP